MTEKPTTHLQNPVSTVVLRMVDSGDLVCSVDAPHTEGYIIGRSDVQNAVPPDIDLAQFDARERGVSRRHAALVRFESGIHLVDLDSVNGTFVNGRRIPSEMPHALHPGDTVGFGDLTVSVGFETP